VTGIIEGLNAFGIQIDEGFVARDKQIGEYGTYLQSERAEIYQAFAKDLVLKDLAYPCFCTEDEISAIREQQEKDKELPGYYGKYAKCRELSFEQIKENIEKGMPYVLRLKSPGSPDRRISFKDGIKGNIEMPENIVDVVVLKADGIPTYHFAHAVDDTLMGTTHVIRGDEWISSVPIHLQLFYCLGLKAPKYAHIAPIMKMEGESKRKLSKRKDPEASVSYYTQEGYPKDGVMEYLLNLANSNFEDFKKQNPKASWQEFPLQMNKMSNSGCLFDLVKMNDMCKNLIALQSAEWVCENAMEWAKEYDKELYELMSKDKDYATTLFSFDRNPEKPRKDIGKWNEVRDTFCYMFDELFAPEYELPENLSKEDIKKIAEKYQDRFNPSLDKNDWFNDLKDLAEEIGFAREVKEYKKNPESFPGNVGDVSSVIRVAVTGRMKSPDLHGILVALGKDGVKARIEKFVKEI
ncbi:MAG: glutamate--tRNA ligase, partial [Oscillospiraceae bacterium]|nr:glutamate--tRNA ligase [Oscillospiraceae bacterium]